MAYKRRSYSKSYKKAWKKKAAPKRRASKSSRGGVQVIKLVVETGAPAVNIDPTTGRMPVKINKRF